MSSKTKKNRRTVLSADHGCGSGSHEYIERCTSRLRENGGRLSTARRAVVQCLAHASQPLTPRQIFEELQHAKDPPQVDLVSVYRNLEALLSYGLVHQVGKGAYFPCYHSDCVEEIHIITHCELCQQTDELHLPADLSRKLQEFVSRSSKSLPHVSSFQVDGRCRRCAKKT